MAKVQLLVLDYETDWLQVLQGGVRANKFYTMVKNGDPVACLMGEGGQGVILGSVYSEGNLPSGDLQGPDVFGVIFSDGTRIKYDGSNLTVNMPLGKKLTINGDVDIAGDLDVSGGIDALSVDATGDVTAGPTGVSLLTHIHSGVTTGPGSSGPPVP